MIHLIKKIKNNRTTLSPQIGRYKITGQGMVEFALALPILLLVVYGLLETGRLLFIYSSTITAARQAARYGSATGSNDSNIPYYRDCDGIDAAVNQVGFINVFDDINVTYDRGIDASGNVVGIPGIDDSPSADTCTSMNDTILQNGDRIKVQVTAQWTPIIAIVPSWQGFTITSEAERTILVEVPIGVDPESELWVPGGALQLTVTSPTASFNGPGQIITYTYSLYNNANFPLHGSFTLSDTIATGNCSSAPGTMAEGTTFTCTGTYTTTQADVDAGYVTNLASVTSTETTSNRTGVTVSAIQNASLTLTKTATPTVATTAGEIVTYTYKLTNSGNVTLTTPYVVTDNKIPSNQINCSGASASIAPGAFTQCTATYAITNTDIINGAVVNTATATAHFQSYDITSNTATAKVSTAPLDLVLSASPTSVSTLNQKITYTYSLKNVGVSPLNAPYTVTDDRATNISCPSASSLAPGATTTCTGEYYVTQTDLNTGGNLVNNAYANSNSGAVKSNTASASVTINQLAAISLTVNPPASPGLISAGTVLNYTYVITNTGNATLSPAYSVTDLNIPYTPNCASNATLAPGQTTTCTLAYTVTQGDMDKGSIVNLAIAKATLNGQPVTSAQATAMVITYSGARVTLSIASTPVSYPKSGTPLSIKFTIKNTGSVNLTSPFTVTTNAFLGAINCTGIASPLTPGQEASCNTVSYTTTATDVANGSIVVSGTASAKYGATTITSTTSTLTIASAFECHIYHRLAATAPPSITYPRTNQMQISVINDISTSDTIHIKSIVLSGWNFASNPTQYIKTILFGGVQIATGTSSQRTNPVTYASPYSGDVSLAPGQTKVLLLSFNKNYSPTGNEVLKLTFLEAGCPLLDSSNSAQVKP